MRYSVIIAALLALGLAGCGQKQEAANPAPQGANPESQMAPPAQPPEGSGTAPSGTGSDQQPGGGGNAGQPAPSPTQ